MGACLMGTCPGCSNQTHQVSDIQNRPCCMYHTTCSPIHKTNITHSNEFFNCRRICARRALLVLPVNGQARCVNGVNVTAVLSCINVMQLLACCLAPLADNQGCIFRYVYSDIVC